MEHGGAMRDDYKGTVFYGFIASKICPKAQQGAMETQWSLWCKTVKSIWVVSGYKIITYSAVPLKDAHLWPLSCPV